jgi:ribosomal protein L11 methyltransferase
MRWAEMSVSCDAAAVDAVSYAFITAGCGGVMITGENPVKIQGSLPVTDELTMRIEGLVSHLDQLEEFGLPALVDRMTIKYAEDEDWANAWKKYFKPLHIGHKLVIKPGWETYEPAEGELVIDLDPGMAFGTGGHPTTRLCMEALEERVVPGFKVADIGTGSGILSITAALLGASEVVATDIDALPRKVARENVIRNEKEAIVSILEMDEFDAKAQDQDLVVANIVANTIIELAPSIAPRVKEGGIFIGSGIVDDHHDLVLGALSAVGLEHVETKREDIWVCLITRKSANAPADPDALKRAAAELPPIGGTGEIR